MNLSVSFSANILNPLKARSFTTKGADVNIGFIGGGNIARAIGNGILENSELYLGFN